MVFRHLGKTGISVSRIGLGTVKIGRNQAVKYSAPFQLPSSEEVQELLNGALALGVNLVDTSPAYGESEVRLAQFIARHRDRIVLSTKAGETFENGESKFDFSVDAILASAASSLRRLKVESLDILLLHSDGNDCRNIEMAWPALARLKGAGIVHAVGISAKTPEGIQAAVRAGFDVIMAPFSLENSSLGPALAEAHDAGLGVIVIKGLQSGFLAGRIEEAIEFILRQRFVDSLVIGTINPAHLKMDIHAEEPLPSTYSR